MYVPGVELPDSLKPSLRLRTESKHSEDRPLSLENRNLVTHGSADFLSQPKQKRVPGVSFHTHKGSWLSNKYGIKDGMNNTDGLAAPDKQKTKEETAFEMLKKLGEHSRKKRGSVFKTQFRSFQEAVDPHTFLTNFEDVKAEFEDFKKQHSRNLKEVIVFEQPAVSLHTANKTKHKHKRIFGETYLDRLAQEENVVRVGDKWAKKTGTAANDQNVRRNEHKNYFAADVVRENINIHEMPTNAAAGRYMVGGQSKKGNQQVAESAQRAAKFQLFSSGLVPVDVVNKPQPVRDVDQSLSLLDRSRNMLFRGNSGASVDLVGPTKSSMKFTRGASRVLASLKEEPKSGLPSLGFLGPAAAVSKTKLDRATGGKFTRDIKDKFQGCLELLKLNDDVGVNTVTKLQNLSPLSPERVVRDTKARRVFKRAISTWKDLSSSGITLKEVKKLNLVASDSNNSN